MAINQAFLKHGLFTEFGIKNALNRYENYVSPDRTRPAPKDTIDRFVHALLDMEIQTLWIQLFSRGDDFDKDNASLRQALIERLVENRILWAGWGYCAGRTRALDLELIKAMKKSTGMTAFVIDAEPGNLIWPDPQHPKDKKRKLPDLWSLEDFAAFVVSVKTLFGKENVGLSTWPVLGIQDEASNPVIKLMQAAEPHVGFFAPQAYWMSFPNQVHYNEGFDRKEFPPDNPVSFVRLVIRSWRDLKFRAPLVITGQAYWGESSRPPPEMAGKVSQFATGFTDWSSIAGFNWYHAGMPKHADEGSMSDDMISSIARARLGNKPYAAV